MLYSLTNINVSERIRELSTIKVLGFYDVEVSMYIYRESLVLTLLGILFGFVLGKILSTVVLKMVEIDFMMFPPTIMPISYLYAGVTFVVVLKCCHVDYAPQAETSGHDRSTRNQVE